MLTSALLAYVATMSITPGPNNLMLAASGVNFGFRRTLPHLVGVVLGHGLQVLLVAFAMSSMARWIDRVQVPLSVVGCGYLLWMAWRQTRATQIRRIEVSRPLGFWSAAAFQWVNPKCWIMALNAVALFLPPRSGWQIAVALAACYLVVCTPCVGLWAWAGGRLRQSLTRPRMLRWFNLTMGALLAATAVWMLVAMVREG